MLGCAFSPQAKLWGETWGKSSVISADGRRQTQSVSRTDENMTPLKGEVFIETLDPAIFLWRDKSLVWHFKNSLNGPDICTTLNWYHCVKYSNTFLWCKFWMAVMNLASTNCLLIVFFFFLCLFLYWLRYTGAKAAYSIRNHIYLYIYIYIYTLDPSIYTLDPSHLFWAFCHRPGNCFFSETGQRCL